MTLRWKVVAFARLMESVLAEHDENKGDDGWLEESPQWLFERLQDEVDELAAVIEESDPQLIAKEATDVANFAMMIVDQVGALKYERNLTEPPTKVCRWTFIENDNVKGYIYDTGCGRRQVIYEGRPAGNCFCGKPIEEGTNAQSK